MTLTLDARVTQERDPRGRLIGLIHVRRPFAGSQPIGAQWVDDVAHEYLLEVADHFQIASMLDGKEMLPPPGRDPSQTEPVLRLASKQSWYGTTTFAFSQTVRGFPVLSAGVELLVNDAQNGVVASRISKSLDPTASGPEPEFGPRGFPSAKALAGALGLRPEDTKGTGWRITSRSHAVYRYEPRDRLRLPRAAKRAAPDSVTSDIRIPRPGKVVGIRAGEQRIVVVVDFTYGGTEELPANWRALLDAASGAVLRLEILAEACEGKVYLLDPRSKGNASITWHSPTAELDRLRDHVQLVGLTPSDPQRLSGQYVMVHNEGGPTAPTRPANACDFSESVDTPNFAMVSAYFQTDRAFRMMEDLGFDVSEYFGPETRFPIVTETSGGMVNSTTLSTANGKGLAGFRYQRLGGTIGSAVNYRSVLHELGHGLLRARTHSGFLGFAHNCGDVLHAILLDPDCHDSADRGATHRFIDRGTCWLRRHDRRLEDDWGWGGPKDDAQLSVYCDSTGSTGGTAYQEEILSSTLFRAYQVSGGDDRDPHSDFRRAVRALAARRLVRVLIDGVARLGPQPAVSTSTAGSLVAAMLAADATGSFEGIPGGTYQKLLPWAFERQGWGRPPGQPTTTRGARPAVDVFVDDGRDGEYEPYQPVFWECPDVWSQNSPDPPTSAEAPIVGETAFAFCKVGNRGTEVARNVRVRAYRCEPGSGMVWPDDFQPMDPPVLQPRSGPDLLPGARGALVGPFQWVPTNAGHDCIVMIAEADGDPSIAFTDSGLAPLPCATGPTPDAFLVPYDNGIAQRNVQPRDAAGEFTYAMTVRNPDDQTHTAEVVVEMPEGMEKWSSEIEGRGSGRFRLKPRGSRRVRFTLSGPGGRTKLPRGAGPIRVMVYLDGRLSGGITLDG